MKLYMGENVELQFVGMKWVNESSVVKNSLNFQSRIFKLSRKDLNLLRIVKRAVLILDGRTWNLKWMVWCFLRLLLERELSDFRKEKSSIRDISIHLESLRRLD